MGFDTITKFVSEFFDFLPESHIYHIFLCYTSLMIDLLSQRSWPYAKRRKAIAVVTFFLAFLICGTARCRFPGEKYASGIKVWITRSGWPEHIAPGPK